MERMGHTVVPVSQEEVRLNDFTFRCFAEVADADYITARMAYRAGLHMQFHWSALQALEKYLKAILLYNRVPTHYLGHGLKEALKKCKRLPFLLELSDSTRDFIEHLDTYGGDRYLVFSYEITSPKLQTLDRAVWDVRRYCRVLNWTGVDKHGTRHNMLQAELDRITDAMNYPPTHFRHPSGLLENIVAKRTHLAREPLLWKNQYFGARSRKPLKQGWMFHFVNSPLTVFPELLDTVLKFVHIPPPAVKAYREHYQVQAKQKKRAKSADNLKSIP